MGSSVNSSYIVGGSAHPSGSMADLDNFFAKKGKKKKKKPTLQNLEDAAEAGQGKQEEEKTQPIVVTSSNPPEV